MKIKKNHIALSLVAVITLGLFSGCAEEKIEFKEYEDYEAFRFYAYMPPPPANVGTGELMDNPDYMTDQQYDWIKECGFNYAVSLYEQTHETTIKALRMFSERGIKFFPQDKFQMRISDMYNNGITEGAELEAAKAQFGANVQEYLQYDSFAGIYAADEPKRDKFDGLAYAQKAFYSFEGTQNSEWWVNLLNSNHDTGFNTYADYAQASLSQIGASRLSFDTYPLLVNSKIKALYFNDLATMAGVGQINETPFDTFVLTMAHWDYRSPENYDDIAWQVYSAMAFGTRGIEPFCYWTTMSIGEGIKYGLVDHYGNRTQIWYSFQEVIKEVNSFQHMYMNADWQGVMKYTADEDYPNNGLDIIPKQVKVEDKTQAIVIDSHPVLTKIKSDRDLVVGVFKDKDQRDAFLVTNITDPDFDKTAEVKLTFKDCNYAMVYKKGRKVLVKLDDGILQMNVGSGEGYYVVPFKA